MNKVYIFGTGAGSSIVQNCLKESVQIAGYIDNDKKKQGQLIGEIKVYDLEKIEKNSLIIISVMAPVVRADIRSQLIANGFHQGKIITFYSLGAILKINTWQLIDIKKWKVEIYERYIGKYVRQYVKKYNMRIYGEKLGLVKNLIFDIKELGGGG